MDTFIVTLDRNDGTERARRRVRADEARFNTSTGALLFFENEEDDRRTVASFADGTWSRFFRADVVPGEAREADDEGAKAGNGRRRRRRRGE
jgi:hypothetical protein